MAKTIWVTEKTNGLLEEKMQQSGFQKKEGFAHAILQAALHDDTLLQGLQTGPAVYRTTGAQELENKGY